MSNREDGRRTIEDENGGRKTEGSISKLEIRELVN